MGRTILESQPGYMTIVIGNGCNIDCPHCYQEKNGDNLLRDKEIGPYLRREFSQLYPFLETLRLQGGEVFALKGFSELVQDVAHSVDRPLISISTNGTLLSEGWCRRIVEMPFQAVTFSFDAGTKETFERLRRGASFDVVVNNVTRLQAYKSARNSWFPNIDAFFVVMRSNFREIPLFMELMLSLQIFEVSFQTMLVDDRNLQREPQLYDEELTDFVEISELHGLLKRVLEKYTDVFDVISFSGLQCLFESVGLSSDFLAERKHTLTPGLEKSRKCRANLVPPKTPGYDLPGVADALIQKNIEQGQCINPWSTLFVTENGDLSLCFLSEPLGNLYSTPLLDIWNSTAAVNKRRKMLAGRFTESGCSSQWCSWRDTDGAHTTQQEDWHQLLMDFNLLVASLLHHKADDAAPVNTKLKAVRRLLKRKDDRIRELESSLQRLWDDNAEIHKKGQQHIHFLEVKVSNLEANQSISSGLVQRWVKTLSGLSFEAVRWLTELPSLMMRFASSGRRSRRVMEKPATGSSNKCAVYCTRPFEMLEVHEHGKAFLCCPQWQNLSIGGIKKTNALAAWNSDIAQRIRQSVLDGSFEYCDRSSCPYLRNVTGPVGSIQQLEDRGVNPHLLSDIRERRTHLAHGPVALNCCYDRSCNLACGSCRKDLIMYRGRDRAEAISIQTVLRDKAMHDVEHLFITGSGDPFGSPGFRSWLRSMSMRECASLVNIHLHTNGQLLNRRMWDSLSEVARDKIHSIEISIDAATEETYKLNRSPGDWRKLMRNLEFIRHLKTTDEIEHVRISMVVQNNNYKEIGDFVRLNDKFGFDEASFSKILNWFPSDKQAERKYIEKAVHLDGHPNHQDFLQALRELNLPDNPNCDFGNLTEYLGPDC